MYLILTFIIYLKFLNISKLIFEKNYIYIIIHKLLNIIEL